MPKSLGGLFAFAVTATIIVIVGSFIYSRVVSPLVAKVMQKAA
jgi:hypothetical protein